MANRCGIGGRGQGIGCVEMFGFGALTTVLPLIRLSLS